MQALNQHLAKTVKQLRKDKGWSLDRTAQETGVSKAMLGQIERMESSPTVATLWKIAGGFNCSLSTFLESSSQDADSPVIRTTDELRRQPATDEMLVATLFPYETRFGFEVFELTLETGYERISEPHEPGVTEHIIVQSGELELLLEGKWLQLPKGASVRFAADQIHGYRNVTQEPAIFLDIIHYSKK